MTEGSPHPLRHVLQFGELGLHAHSLDLQGFRYSIHLLRGVPREGPTDRGTDEGAQDQVAGTEQDANERVVPEADRLVARRQRQLAACQPDGEGPDCDEQRRPMRWPHRAQLATASAPAKRAGTTRVALAEVSMITPR